MPVNNQGQPGQQSPSGQQAGEQGQNQGDQTAQRQQGTPDESAQRGPRQNNPFQQQYGSRPSERTQDDSAVLPSANRSD